MNSDRGTTQRQFDFANEVEEPSSVELLRTESTDPASSDQPALDASSVDALLELDVDLSKFFDQSS